MNGDEQNNGPTFFEKYIYHFCQSGKNIFEKSGPNNKLNPIKTTTTPTRWQHHTRTLGQNCPTIVLFHNIYSVERFQAGDI